MPYKIEKNIQPVRKSKVPTTDHGYPLIDMRIGDSFLVVGELYNNASRTKINKRVRTYNEYISAKRKKPEMLTRKYRAGRDPWDPNNPESGKYVRVWRLE